MELTWHGHSTWYIEANGTSLLIDPFFDNPKTDLDPEDIEAPDFVVLTHGHADHIANVEAFADATVVATPELAGFVEEEFGASDTVGMNIGGTLEVGDLFVTMHRADHTNGANTGYEYGVGMPVGLLVSTERPGRDGSGTSFYHAGDTGLMSEMRDVIGPFLQPTAVAVPIGDHFTMGPWQAAIAVDWVDADHAFPMHYDTFPPIEQDPDDFAAEVEDTGSTATVHVLAGDESAEI
jgi:L-ascorbate metabolism protein UlaG (beta-lactamase superfamily)